MYIFRSRFFLICGRYKECSPLITIYLLGFILLSSVNVPVPWSYSTRLTGIPNRRRYESDSLTKWQDAIRFGLPFSIFMMDIDHFKLYNDTFGHPAGDQVISSVAKTVSAHFRRATDLFARYGGEEFVAVFLGNNSQSAFDFVKSIRQAVEDLHIPHNSPVSPWVTVSIGGVSIIPKAGDDYATFLKLADTMLYDAKRFGRNQVVWYSENKEQWRER